MLLILKKVFLVLFDKANFTLHSLLIKQIANAYNATHNIITMIHITVWSSHKRCLYINVLIIMALYTIILTTPTFCQKYN